MPLQMRDILNRLAAADVAVRRRVVGALALLVVAAFLWSWRDLPHDWYEATRTDHRPLYHARSWHYQLANVDIDKIAATESDVVVVDYAIAGVPLTPEQVARLKVRPDGKRRIILSYLSVGEGEEKRFYWHSEWTTDPASRPSWIKINNCAWPGAWAVRFWQDGWKDIVYRAPESYLKRIIGQGFDGVYLDRVDMFEDYPGIADERPRADREMIALVAELAATGRALKPGFIVVPNNGVGLLAERDFRRAIDGIGMEELLYSEKATGVRNAEYDIRQRIALLTKLQWEYKPVFLLEYLNAREQIAAAKAELDALGIVSAFPTRALDGGDPTAPAVELRNDPGTPEYVASKCTKANSW